MTSARKVVKGADAMCLVAFQGNSHPAGPGIVRV